MDWFNNPQSDDEDDIVEEQEISHDSNGNSNNEEDPLDAYMKSLETSTTTTNASTKEHRAERLNILNEDEATDHWKEPTPITNHDTNVTESSSFPNITAARHALESTFHRAGQGSAGHHDDADQSDDGDSLFSIRAKKKLKQEQFEANIVRQLAAPVQNETNIPYEDFHKQFWTPADTMRGQTWRQQHSITCHPVTMDPLLEFSELNSVFGDTLLDAITKQFTHPTLVQSQTLPIALSGKDAIVTAATGSGKTLAYVWPMIVHVCDQRPLDRGETGPVGCILVPTRELCQQVHSHVSTFLQTQPNSKSVCITGGTSKYHLVQQLKQRGVDIVVATPGRFLDVLQVQKKGGMTLQRTTMIVLDEADKMLDMGFEQQCTSILRKIRPDRQSLLLSATMGRKVERLAREWLQSDAIRISVGRTGEASQHVDQHVMVLPNYHAKKQWFLEMLPVLARVGKTLVFVATRADCEVLAELIRANTASSSQTTTDATTSQLVVETLHGDKHQSDRNKALKAFSKGKLGALIATDVAARGLDVRDVSTVVNFDPAKTLDAHVHRVGRAGRLQNDEHQKGVAYTLLTPKNADFAHTLSSAFEREGRDVTDELKTLAGKSRRSGNVAARTKWNKSGLGFHEDDPSSSSLRDEQRRELARGHSGHYGPPTLNVDVPPPRKRSRWG